MATFTLSASIAYSAFVAANPSFTSGDTIALAGFVLTIDTGTPSASGVTVTAVGNAGTILFGAASAYTLTGWVFRAGTTTIWNNQSKTVTGATFYGGSVSGAHGIYGNNSNGFNLISCSFFSGSASGAHGINLAFSSTTFNGCTFTGGSVSGAYAGQDQFGAGPSFTGTTTMIGGSVSGAHAYVEGANAITLYIASSFAISAATTGAYGLSTAGVLIIDIRLLTGVCVSRTNITVAYGGTSTANFASTSGTFKSVPAPADVRSGTSVMGETGTLSAGKAVGKF